MKISKEYKKVLEEIKLSNLSMCNLEVSEDGFVWMNPNDQECFNAGWYSMEDFKNFLNGTGKIIKGKTQEDKYKFLEYYRFKKTYHSAWSICYSFPYFDKIREENFKTRWNGYIEERIKICHKNPEEDIMKIFGYFIPSIVSSLDIFGKICDEERYNIVYKEYRNIFYGIGTALMLQGYGYFGYTNKPAEVYNFSWYRDIVFAYSYYKHLLEMCVKMPDFNFVEKNGYNNEMV